MIPRRGAGRDEGQALIEFALMLPVVLMLILGLFDVARAIEQENTLAFAAREGSRYAIVHGAASGSPIAACTSCQDPTIAGVVTSAAISVPNVTVTVDYPDLDNYRGSRVTVDATAPFVPLPSQWLLNGALTITLRGGSTLVVQY